MRRAVLLYNPVSGRPHQRLATIQQIKQALGQQGIATTLLPTEGPGTAGVQAAEACRSSPDILFACGGDGTLHEVLQGMTFQPRTALGVIPLGSANALARHLRLSLNPVRAALQQLAYTPQSLPVGNITFTTPTGSASRYFLVVAGAGPDGALVYRMLASGKHRLGRLMYYVRSAQLFATHRFSAFSVTANGQTHLAVSAMAVRVSSLGGIFGPLARNASMDRPHLTLTLARPPAYLSLPAWFILSWARLQRFNRYALTIPTDTFTCGPGLTAPIQVEADGEHLGTTPITITLLPDALRLLLPPQQANDLVRLSR